jgi:hypothetical protein
MLIPMSEPLTSLIVVDGIMYDCTRRVKDEVNAMLGRINAYRKKKCNNFDDLEYAVRMEINMYMDKALEEGTAAYAGLAKEAA